MNSRIRLATAEYCYIEFDYEGSAEDTIAEHNRIVKMYRGGFGLEPKEFNKALDLYLTENTMDSNVYEQMDISQQNVIQQIKKAFKRINPPELRDNK